MPGRFLTDAQRARLSRLPDDVTDDDLAAHFTLTEADLAVVERRRVDDNRLGFALQLCTLRFIGFVPDDVRATPPRIVEYVAKQLSVAPSVLDGYAIRDQTRTDHQAEAEAVLGFRSPAPEDISALAEWLLERALEHDKPTLLLDMAAEHLRATRVVRPGITVVERLVVTTREQAEHETLRRLDALLTAPLRALLRELLQPNEALRRTPLAWLRTPATAATPNTIVGELDKLRFVRRLGADGWDLSSLTPNRRKFLAQLARRSTNQALLRAPDERQYPALVAFAAETVTLLTDELVDLFDRALSGYHAQAKRRLDDLKVESSDAKDAKLALLADLARVILDAGVADEKVRATIYEQVLSADELALAVAEASQLAHAERDPYVGFLEAHYNHVRKFAPDLLASLDFRANAAAVDLVAAVAVLRRLNAEGRRRVPDDAPLGFVPAKWRLHVVAGDGTIHRRSWEMCLLMELRNALRAGDVWVVGSRRYANPESFLIAPERWPTMRTEVCAMLGVPLDPRERLAASEALFRERIERLERALETGEAARIEDGRLVVPRVKAEEGADDGNELQELIAERLPRVQLPELLIEVDRWSGFSPHFTHAAGAPTRSPDLAMLLYAAIVAQACNFGVTKMADAAELTYAKLAWATQWYVREDTLAAANAAIVNYQHGLPLAKVWGGGALSSSDGQRFPVPVKSTTARAIPRYFGFGRGLTHYSWVSDQFSIFGTKVIPSTVRDATYVLDGLLDNETDLELVEHTTDTAGYTDIVFALFDLLGYQFAPRLRDLDQQQLYRVGPIDGFPLAASRIKGSLNRAMVVERWDDVLRAAGSLKRGWVTASLLISRLQASRGRQNALAKALQEYGKIPKTLFVLRFLESPSYRRTINRQLNKGESMHALRSFLAFGEDGKIRHRHLEDQQNQASCLNLVTNAVIAWNTVYIAAAVEQLRAEGRAISDEELTHLSPTMRAHVNPYGKYTFDPQRVPGPSELRPLRTPGIAA